MAVKHVPTCTTLLFPMTLGQTPSNWYWSICLFSVLQFMLPLYVLSLHGFDCPSCPHQVCSCNILTTGIIGSSMYSPSFFSLLPFLWLSSLWSINCQSCPHQLCCCNTQHSWKHRNIDTISSNAFFPPSLTSVCPKGEGRKRQADHRGSVRQTQHVSFIVSIPV